MKNYDAYCAGIFETNIDEINRLSKDGKFSSVNYEEDLAHVKKSFGTDIVDFTLKSIPLNWTRGTWDNACLLVFRRASGNYYAKRHNNSQWLSLGNK